MASREKRPLAPSKSKQKASGDSGLPPNEVKNKKGKSLPNIKQQQPSREVFDTVEIGSQFPAKLESNLPRKKALKSLKRKQNLRVTKANLVKSKVNKKVTSKSIREVSLDSKKGVKAKKAKLSEESSLKAIGVALKSESQTNSGDNEAKGTETPSKSAKNNLRTKKTKFTPSRSTGGASVNEDTRDKEEASAAASQTKSSLKLGKKKVIETADSLSKSAKTAKSANVKKNSIGKDTVARVTESDNKAKGRKSASKELDCGASVKSNTSVEKFQKVVLDDKNSIDNTIDEVIASVLNDSETDSQQGVTEKTEGKVTRSRKMMVDENIASDIEIKKEPDTEDTKAMSEGEYAETDQELHFQNAVHLRKRSKVSNNSLVDQVFQRSLRNGKQRHLSDSGNDVVDPKRRRLNSEGPPISDNSIEHTSDCNASADSCLSDPSCTESQTTVSANKEICLLRDEASKNLDEDTEAGSELENNNNSDRADRTGEIGPTLRSKTKAKTTESEVTKDDNMKIEETWISSKCVETQDDSKKLNNLDQVKKDSILAKLTDKSNKGRKNSLNIDIKKTVNSFYTDKSDGNSTLQIDQMIENIKLNIAKSIENKIFGPGSKYNDVPKIEEVIAPLNTESQKMGLEENTDENKSSVKENESTSESSENSVPKVADTAKEIEKLVMFDIEEAETHSQNIQENKASGSDRINDVHNICESTCNISSNNGASRDSVAEPEVGDDDCNMATGTSVNVSDGESKTLDENKKAVTTRKSSRISDKSSDSTTSNPEAKKLPNRILNKALPKSDNAEDVTAETLKSTKNEETAPTCDSYREDVTTSQQLSDDRDVSSHLAPTLASSEEAKKLTEEQGKSTQESETELFLNISDASEESETLESISREVERLVAGDQAAKSSPNDTIQCKQAASDTKVINKEQQESESANKEETLVCHDDSFALLESATSFSETSSKSRADNAKAADATDTLQESDAFCKTSQNTKHHKTNNNHLPTITNCDSSSKCSFMNPVPVVRTCTSDRQNDEIEEHKLDRDGDYKELDKTDDNLAANCDIPKNSNENTAASDKSEHNETTTTDESNKSSDDKCFDEQKPVNEENRRVLRARDKQKKATENKQTAARGNREHVDGIKIKVEETGVQKVQNASVQMDTDEIQGMDETVVSESREQRAEDTGDAQNNNELDDLEPQARTRRSREGKRRREESIPLTGSLKAKRAKRKSDQQNKEETLLDNEVAKINENNRFLDKYTSGVGERTDSFRGFFEGARGVLDKNGSNLRSKSENDLMVDGGSGKSEERLSRNLSENQVSKRDDDIDILSGACKTFKTPEASVQKDFDEASTSSESCNSGTPKILETPEDKAKKESIMAMLGLETLEKAAERQKARKEQQYTGTLKTIIRVQKDKDKGDNKRGSRSPLKMVLKQQGRGDGESDSPEFYTIQKEVRVHSFARST